MYPEKPVSRVSPESSGKLRVCSRVVFDGWEIPVYRHKDQGEVVKGDDILMVQCRSVLAGRHLNERARIMTKEVDAATEIANTAVDNFSKAMARLHTLQQEFAESGKKASSSVRDSADKLSQGLARIEKAANFDRLEKYVELLERAASAMQALSVIEASGKLDKIAAAIR